jgi:flagellar protein FlbD
MLTRLNGPEFALNADLIERAERTPDTVITLVDGKHYVVAESLEEVIERIGEHRALMLSAATRGCEQPRPRWHASRHEPDAEGSEVIRMRRNS